MFLDRKYDIISFGSATIDIFLLSKEFTILSGEKTGLGKTAICLTHQDKIEVEQRILSSGGGGTNTAVSFSRLGLKTALVCRFGQDIFSQIVLDELKREKNLNLGQVVRKKGDQTDQSVILLTPDGQRTILVYRGETRLEKTDIKWSSLNTKWFYLASLEGNLALTAELINFAYKKGIKVAWNPGKKELVQREKILALSKSVNLISLNQEEACFLLETNQNELWQQTKKVFSPLLVITQGKKGATIISGNQKFYRPIFPVQTIDETGAGDSFNSGLIAGLAKGLSLPESLKWGMANSASVVSQIGAKSGLLTEKKLKEFIARYS